ncbi:DUF1302 domain-containing protein [Ideonella azotifigens]|nr:DUF1302 domain-containing protein [Ideonella azotifigens]MCD2344972.1 DUF1302 domain-containing protein [Ideonella azotifigens]
MKNGEYIRRVEDARVAVFPKAIVIACAAAASGVHAFSFDTGSPDVKLRWDNTFKYSAATRLKERSNVIMEDAGGDDGDRNFARGLISNRLDIFSELDASYKNVGVRLSGAAWYDTVYNSKNDNNSPATSNNVSVPYNEFTRETRNRMGRKGELLDAFGFVNGSVADMKGTLRLGRHSLVFGESLFFGQNGIANAQGPLDLVKLVSVPSSQFKEVLRPVNQVSGQLQISPVLSIGAYYQFEWKESILPPAGSYLSTLDFVGEGGERLGPWPRGADIKPRNSGQGGIQLRYRASSIDTEFGLYAVRYHDKTPQIYLTTDFTTPQIPGLGTPHNFVNVYPEGIQTYGASASTVLGELNLAGEVSVRNNAPLVGDAALVQYNAGADNVHNPAYPVGKTAHAQVSGIYSMGPGTLWQGAFLLAEVAWNRTLSITRNSGALDPNTTRDALALRILFTPSYYQVLPGLDLSLPIGLGYNPKGRSSAVFGFNGGVEHGGDISIGLTGEYESVWTFGINYVKYLGKESTYLSPPNSNSAVLSYGQSLKDRDFLSLNIKRTF